MILNIPYILWESLWDSNFSVSVRDTLRDTCVILIGHCVIPWLPPERFAGISRCVSMHNKLVFHAYAMHTPCIFHAYHIHIICIFQAYSIHIPCTSRPQQIQKSRCPQRCISGRPPVGSELIFIGLEDRGQIRHAFR